eukprot:scaffold40_cov305-Pinguiococcus_pyrenoidosus.AAC.24
MASSCAQAAVRSSRSRASESSARRRSCCSTATLSFSVANLIVDATLERGDFRGRRNALGVQLRLLLEQDSVLRRQLRQALSFCLNLFAQLVFPLGRAVLILRQVRDGRHEALLFRLQILLLLREIRSELLGHRLQRVQLGLLAPVHLLKVTKALGLLGVLRPEGLQLRRQAIRFGCVLHNQPFAQLLDLRRRRPVLLVQAGLQSLQLLLPAAQLLLQAICIVLEQLELLLGRGHAVQPLAQVRTLSLELLHAAFVALRTLLLRPELLHQVRHADGQSRLRLGSLAEIRLKRPLQTRHLVAEARALAANVRQGAPKGLDELVAPGHLLFEIPLGRLGLRAQHGGDLLVAGFEALVRQAPHRARAARGQVQLSTKTPLRWSARRARRRRQWRSSRRIRRSGFGLRGRAAFGCAICAVEPTRRSDGPTRNALSRGAGVIPAIRGAHLTAQTAFGAKDALLAPKQLSHPQRND